MGVTDIYFVEYGNTAYQSPIRGPWDRRGEYASVQFGRSRMGYEGGPQQV